MNVHASYTDTGGCAYRCRPKWCCTNGEENHCQPTDVRIVSTTILL